MTVTSHQSFTDTTFWESVLVASSCFKCVMILLSTFESAHGILFCCIHEYDCKWIPCIASVRSIYCKPKRKKESGSTLVLKYEYYLIIIGATCVVKVRCYNAVVIVDIILNCMYKLFSKHERLTNAAVYISEDTVRKRNVSFPHITGTVPLLFV